MRLNEFELIIPEGNEVNQYVHIEHGQQYTVTAKNHGSLPCDATIKIDGKKIGRFRVNPYDSISLERPVDDNGKFTFLESASIEAVFAGNGLISKNNKGIVEIEFQPVKNISNATPLRGIRGSNMSDYSDLKFSMRRINIDNVSCSTSTLSEGITGLTGQSNQFFENAKELIPVGQSTTIIVRLVGKTKPQNTVRPLNTYRTPVPPPVSGPRTSRRANTDYSTRKFL